MAAERILIVDDDRDIRESMGEYLQGHGYEVALAENGEAMRKALAAAMPAVVLLDLNMPGEDGLSLARWLRAHHDVAIIMVTGAGEVVDRVIGLEVGADDYVTKPFRLRELVARVRAALRRGPRADATQDADRDEEIEIGDVRVDVARHEVVVGGSVVPLPRKEFELLELLMLNAGRVLTRDVLIDRVWGPNYFGDTKTLDVHIKRLRSKIEVDPAHPTRIMTVRGIGYRFERGP